MTLSFAPGRAWAWPPIDPSGFPWQFPGLFTDDLWNITRFPRTQLGGGQQGAFRINVGGRRVVMTARVGQSMIHNTWRTMSSLAARGEFAELLGVGFDRYGRLSIAMEDMMTAPRGMRLLGAGSGAQASRFRWLPESMRNQLFDDMLSLMGRTEDGWLDNIMVRVLKPRSGGPLRVDVRRIDPPKGMTTAEEILHNFNRGPSSAPETHGSWNQAATLRAALGIPGTRPHPLAMYKVAEGYGLAAEAGEALSAEAAATARGAEAEVLAAQIRANGLRGGFGKITPGRVGGGAVAVAFMFKETQRGLGKGLEYTSNQYRQVLPESWYQADAALGSYTRPFFHNGFFHTVLAPMNFVQNAAQFQLFDDNWGWNPGWAGSWSAGCPECAGH
jgi:hypothetical protein